MASVTGVPERVHPNSEVDPEVEPLLGRPGDAAQPEGVATVKNLILGTGIVAQLGIVLFFALIWVSVFIKPVILFSGHPLAQSFGILALVQSILSVQPAITADQKRSAQWFHASLNFLALAAFITGVVIIEVNKFSSNGPHFHSVHGYLGVIASIIILLQYSVGFTMWATPSLYGGENKAKAIWKYHRISGYLVLVLLLATACSASDTDFNKTTLHVRLWAVTVPSVLILIGIIPRIQLFKLGIKRERS